MYVLDKPDNLPEMFEQSVEKFGHNKWLGTKNKKKNQYKWITYRQAAVRVDNFRAGLSFLGIKQGSSVGIIANNRLEWAIACYATYGLGACFVPMYEMELEKTWDYVIRDARISVLLISNSYILNKISHWLRRIETLKHVILIDGDGNGSMSDVENKGISNPVSSMYPKSQEIAGLLYTSGTTGVPKGVLLTHGNLTSNIHAGGKIYKDLDESTRTLSFLPWAHAYGQTAELHFIMNIGGSTGIAESTKTIVNDLSMVKPLFLVAVPRVFNVIHDKIIDNMNKKGGLAKFLFNMGISTTKNRRELSKKGKKSFINNLKIRIIDAIVFKKIRRKFGGRLSYSLSASAALNPVVAEFFYDIGIPVYEAWGMTELSPAGTMNSPSNNKIGSAGLPLEQVTLVIDKTEGGNDPREGELIVYGPNVMKGYHNKPKETRSVMTKNGGIRTGDKAYVDEDGYLFITGRIKEQFKLENGKFVHPVAIEEEIKLLPFVEHIMLFGLNKPYTVCLLFPKISLLKRWPEWHKNMDDINSIMSNENFSSSIIKQVSVHLEGKFPVYEIPKKIIIIDEEFSVENGMLTQTLKVKRQEILKRYADRIDYVYGK